MPALGSLHVHWLSHLVLLIFFTLPPASLGAAQDGHSADNSQSVFPGIGSMSPWFLVLQVLPSPGFPLWGVWLPLTCTCPLVTLGQDEIAIVQESFPFPPTLVLPSPLHLRHVANGFILVTRASDVSGEINQAPKNRCAL